MTTEHVFALILCTIPMAIFPLLLWASEQARVRKYKQEHPDWNKAAEPAIDEAPSDK
jgi:hypothetical protein